MFKSLQLLAVTSASASELLKSNKQAVTVARGSYIGSGGLQNYKFQTSQRNLSSHNALHQKKPKEPKRLKSASQAKSP